MKPLRIISWEPRTVERMAECFVEYLATRVSFVVESLMQGIIPTLLKPLCGEIVRKDVEEARWLGELRLVVSKTSLYSRGSDLASVIYFAVAEKAMVKAVVFVK